MKRWWPAAFAATVLVLACAAAPAGASHVSCGDVITADTTLDSDLVGCPSTALVIGAGGVTLDLNGHTVGGTGRGGGPYIGIDDSRGYDDVVVENGTVRGFEQGIVLSDVSRGELRGLVVTANNLEGIALIRSDGNVVERSNVSGNTGFGVELTGGTFIPQPPGSHDNRIEDNTFFDDGGGGVVMDGSDRNVVIGNVFRDDAAGNDAAIAIYGSVGTRIERNLLTHNRNFGILASGSPETLIAGNSEGGGYGGIVIASDVQSSRVGSGSRADSNVASDNTGYGIWISLSPSNSVTNNTTSGNAVAGIFASSTQNQIAGNLANDNPGDGILLQGAHDTLVTGNTARKNGDDGIDLDSAGNTVAQNKAINNADLGIESIPGNVDGGGNKGNANGNRAQCLNIACK